MKKIQPTIVIGIGGTGVKTITYLKKIILEQAPHSMNTTRFIAIDIDDLSPDSSVMPLGLFKKEISLDRQNNEFYQIVSSEREAGLRGTPEIQNWFPEEAYNLLPLTEGARQVKSIGRLGFFLDHNNIHQRLTLKSDRLVTPDILDEFPNLRGDGYNVYVISSICGGTGAGLFYDIAYDLRFLQTEGIIPLNARIKGLFALGDVYEGITDRVHANTYASLRELNWAQRANASYRPVYPGTMGKTIQDQAFDTIYLIGKSNESNIQFNEPDDFSVLCAEFIFLDSGADREITVNINGEMEMREPLATVIQSTRNNPEPYASIIDADGTPRCYSALGLCKIRFPAQQVAELCSARMSMSIICHHILGDLNPDSVVKKIEQYIRQQIQEPDILDNLSAQFIIESEKKAVKFFGNKELRCDEIDTDLPDRLIELKDNGNYIPLDQWAEDSLKKAHAFDSKNLKKLEAGRFNTIIKAIDHKIRDLQNEMSSILINELQTFQDNIEREINDIFGLKEIDDPFEPTHGTRYIATFLKELIELSRESTRFAEDKISELKKKEKPFQIEMQKQIREMADLLKKKLVRDKTKREKLNNVYRSINTYFKNKIHQIKMAAAVQFSSGVRGSNGALLEEHTGRGMLARLSILREYILRIEEVAKKILIETGVEYVRHKKITGSPFEILVYDNKEFKTLEESYQEVYSEILRKELFGENLRKVSKNLGKDGVSIWNIAEYYKNHVPLRDTFMGNCIIPFIEDIDQKTVAHYILNPKYNATSTDQILSSYRRAGCYCHLNNGEPFRHAGLRRSDQSFTCVVRYMDHQDESCKRVEGLLQQMCALEGAGAAIRHSHTSNKHNILIYREFCGFPAYVLNRIQTYKNHYITEERKQTGPPIQMLREVTLPDINVPDKRVQTKNEITTIDALVLGTIYPDGEHYYFNTLDEWKRRKRAEQARARGEKPSLDDLHAGRDHNLGRSIAEVIAKQRGNFSIDEKWAERVKKENAERKKILDDNQRQSLYEAMYFGGYSGTEGEHIDLKIEIRPSIEFILENDFRLKTDEIKKPELSHDELLLNYFC